MLKSISLCRKTWPAGRTLQQNNSFPINESILFSYNFDGVKGRVAQKVMPACDLALCLLP